MNWQISDKKPTITTILTPALFQYAQPKEDFICVIVDILRATTTMVTAIDFGATLIPVETIEEAQSYKNRGYLVAGERIEENLPFADFGNSALLFRSDKIKGKEICHTTTNGTKALNLARKYKPQQIIIGAFSNLVILKDYLIKQNKDVYILCSGWKNTFCLEDTLFSGALSLELMKEGFFATQDDSTYAAIDLYNKAKDDILKYLEKASHIHRLRKAHFDDVFQYTFTFNTCHCVPIYKNNKLIDALQIQD